LSFQHETCIHQSDIISSHHKTHAAYLLQDREQVCQGILGELI